jgi:hypothetical protein
MTKFDYESIPAYEPIEGEGGGFGPGLSEEDIPKVKPAEIIDDPIAVIGFLTLPNGFKMEDSDPDTYTLVEIIDIDGNNFVFSTSANALVNTLHKRFEADPVQIPFKTSLTMKKSKAGRDYYVFT